MSTKEWTPRTWGIAFAILLPGSLIAAGAASVLMNAVVRAPIAASLTTLFPGSVYASATILKVCLVLGLASGVLALITALTKPRTPEGWSVTRAKPRLPRAGTAALALVPLTPLIGGLAVSIAQVLALRSTGLSFSDFSDISRAAVIVQSASLAAAGLTAVVSLVRREAPSLFAILAFVASVVLLALFWYFQFAAPGFDQDLWAPRAARGIIDPSPCHNPTLLL